MTSVNQGLCRSPRGGIKTLACEVVKSCIYSYNLHLLSTNINFSRFDFFFSSLFSLECESPYVSSSQLALFPCECSLSEVSDSPLYEDIVEIVLKYNKTFGVLSE